MMGVYSELYIDFIENYPQLIEGTEKFDFMFDMFIALKTTDGVKPNPLIAEFLKMSFVNYMVVTFFGRWRPLEAIAIIFLFQHLMKR